MVSDIGWLDNKEKWAGLASIAMVEARHEMGDKVTVQRR